MAMNELALYACDQCYRCKTRCGRQIPQCERCRGQNAICTYSVAGPETVKISPTNEFIGHSTPESSSDSGFQQPLYHRPPLPQPPPPPIQRATTFDYSSDPCTNFHWIHSIDASSAPLLTAPAAIFSDEPSFPFGSPTSWYPADTSIQTTTSTTANFAFQNATLIDSSQDYIHHELPHTPYRCVCIRTLVELSKSLHHTNIQPLNDGFSACEQCLSCCAASDDAASLACLVLLQKILAFLQHYGAVADWSARALMILGILETAIMSHGRVRSAWMEGLLGRLREDFQRGSWSGQ